MRIRGRAALHAAFAVVCAFALVVAAPATSSAQSCPAWAPNTAYAVGATVTYGGAGYRCLQAHTSLVGWEPPNAPALWTAQACSGTATPTSTTPRATATATTARATATGRATATATTARATLTSTPRPTNTATIRPTATPTNSPTVTPTSLPAGYVQMYQHCNYGGWVASFRVGSYNTAALQAAGAANNDGSSLLIPSGYTVTLYDGDNFTGSSTVLTGDSTCLGSFNDLPSSMIISGPTPTPTKAPTGVVQVYGDCNYAGWTASFAAGSYNTSALQAAGAVNNGASSLRIPSGMTVMLYDADNFGGASVTLSGDTSCLVGVSLNDLLSSMTVSAGPQVTFFAFGDPQYGGGSADQNRFHVAAMNAFPGKAWPAVMPSGGQSVGRPSGVLIAGDLTQDGKDGRPEYNGVAGKNELGQFIADYGLRGSDGVLKYPLYEGYGNHDFDPAEPNDDNPTDWRYYYPDDPTPSVQAVINRNARRLGLTNVTSDGGHYSWDWAGVHFVNVNVFPGNEPSDNDATSLVRDPRRSLNFLAADLAQHVGSTCRPVIIMSHYGFSGSSLNNLWWKDSQREAFRQVAQNYNVIAFIHGHQHDTGIGRWNGIDWFNVGSPYYATENLDGRGHFSVFRINGNTLEAADARWSPGAAGLDPEFPAANTPTSGWRFFKTFKRSCE